VQRKEKYTILNTFFLIDGSQVAPDFPFVRRELKLG
jgi:hypothetical protein